MGLRRAGSSRRQPSLLRGRTTRRLLFFVPGFCCVVWLDVFPLVLSSPSHPPNAQYRPIPAPGAGPRRETWQQCRNQQQQQQQHFLSLRYQRHSRCLQVLLGHCNTAATHEARFPRHSYTYRTHDTVDLIVHLKNIDDRHFQWLFKKVIFNMLETHCPLL